MAAPPPPSLIPTPASVAPTRQPAPIATGCLSPPPSPDAAGPPAPLPVPAAAISVSTTSTATGVSAASGSSKLPLAAAAKAMPAASSLPLPLSSAFTAATSLPPPPSSASSRTATSLPVAASSAAANAPPPPSSSLPVRALVPVADLLVPATTTDTASTTAPTAPEAVTIRSSPPPPARTATPQGRQRLSKLPAAAIAMGEASSMTASPLTPARSATPQGRLRLSRLPAAATSKSTGVEAMMPASPASHLRQPATHMPASDRTDTPLTAARPSTDSRIPLLESGAGEESRIQAASLAASTPTWPSTADAEDGAVADCAHGSELLAAAEAAAAAAGTPAVGSGSLSPPPPRRTMARRASTMSLRSRSSTPALGSDTLPLSPEEVPAELAALYRHAARSNCLACRLKLERIRALQEANPWRQRRLVGDGSSQSAQPPLSPGGLVQPLWKPVGQATLSAVPLWPASRPDSGRRSSLHRSHSHHFSTERDGTTSTSDRLTSPLPPTAEEQLQQQQRSPGTPHGRSLSAAYADGGPGMATPPGARLFSLGPLRRQMSGAARPAGRPDGTFLPMAQRGASGAGSPFIGSGGSWGRSGIPRPRSWGTGAAAAPATASTEEEDAFSRALEIIESPLLVADDADGDLRGANNDAGELAASVTAENGAAEATGVESQVGADVDGGGEGGPVAGASVEPVGVAVEGYDEPAEPATVDSGSPGDEGLDPEAPANERGTGGGDGTDSGSGELLLSPAASEGDLLGSASSSAASAAGDEWGGGRRFKIAPSRRRRRVDMKDLTGVASLLATRMGEMEAAHTRMLRPRGLDLAAAAVIVEARTTYLDAAADVAMLGCGLATAWGTVAAACADARLAARLRASLAACEAVAMQLRAIARGKAAAAAAAAASRDEGQEVDREAILLAAARNVAEAARAALADLEAAQLMLVEEKEKEKEKEAAAVAAAAVSEGDAVASGEVTAVVAASEPSAQRVVEAAFAAAAAAAAAQP
ncbi:hypothetical protein HK405_005738 [Cladochytrium tenue]|nr:hypothetical protein HK405_005738 [Cladochytrium tenue]